MSSIIHSAELEGVHVLAGLGNIFGSVVSSLTSSAAVAASPSTAGAPSVSGLLGSIGDVEAAVTEIEVLVADIEGGKWTAAPEDVVTLLKTFMAILSRFGVDVPILSQVVAALPRLPAVAA